MTTEYKLTSGELVNAPGVVLWAINGAKFEKDRDTMIKIIADTWKVVPVEAVAALVTQQVPFAIEDDAVIFRWSDRN